MNNKNIIEYYPYSKRIILLGTFPPPIGGVSIHLKRLSKLLEREGVDVIKWDISKGRFLFYPDCLKYFVQSLLKGNTILHLNALNIKYLITGIFFRLFARTEIYITNHNVSFFQTKTLFREKLFYYLVKKSKRVFVINEHILKEYPKDLHNELPIKLISPFLTPDFENEEEIIASYPSAIWKFLKNRQPILLSNASRLNFFKNEDLYGLDMCIELTYRLKRSFKSVGFIFAIADEKFNKEYLKEMKKRIEELDIAENFFFLEKNNEIWPLFKKIDIFVRATNTDGFGISVAEALFFNKSAVASNVCPRPEGTVLFKSRDVEDLYKKTMNVLKGKFKPVN